MVREAKKVISMVGLAAGVMVMLFSGCEQQQAPQATRPQITKAVAVLHPTEGNNVTGVVYFTRMENGVKIEAKVEGLTPGEHGFHIHEFGDCSSGDGKSAGGHFNPEGKSHGAPDAAERHVGDLGNLTADDAGVAKYERVDSHLSLNGPNSIIGRAVIIHEKADDLTSQPTGAAGSRLACGVIGIARP